MQTAGQTRRSAPTGKNNKTKEHKNKKINNMLLLFEKRRGTACGGGDEKTQAKKVKLPPPAGTPSLLQKRGRVLITGLPLRQKTTSAVLASTAEVRNYSLLFIILQ